MNLQNMCIKIAQKLLTLSLLPNDNIYNVNYYTEDCTIKRIDFNNMLCYCEEYDLTHDQFFIKSIEWDTLSEDIQLILLLQIINKYCM